MNHETSGARRIAGLDLIRGLAVALVIYCHAFPRQAGSTGQVGVVMFFTLSGYLITGLLMSDIRRFGRIRYGRFYRNRALRLLPPLIFLLLGYAAIVFVFAPDLRRALPRDLGIGIGYLTDVPGITGSPALQHLWTLATEEQFYLVWPALIALAFAMHRFWPAFASVAVLIIGAFTIEWSLGVGDGTTIYRAPWSWTMTILIGAAAQITLRSWRPSRALRVVLLTAATVGIAFYSLLPTGPAWILLYVVIAPLAALLTVGMIVVLRDWVDLPSEALRPIFALGTISYAAYLWDFPIVIASEHVKLNPTVGIVATIVMATVSWWLIEKPVARWRARLDAHTDVTRRVDMHLEAAETRQ